MARWETIAGNPRFLALSPEAQDKVRRSFQERQAGLGGEGMPNYDRGHVHPLDGGPAKAGWVNDLGPDQESALKHELEGLTPDEREEKLGLATGRLTKNDEGQIGPRPMGPEPTFGERMMAETAPIFRGAAKAQGAIEYPFKTAGDYVTEHSEPYLEKVMPPSAARVASRLAGGALEYLPYTPLLGGEGGAAEAGAGAGRLLSRLAMAEGKTALRRTIGAGIRMGGVEAERTAVGAENEGRELRPGELGEAATEGFAGGAGGHAAISEVAAPLAKSAFRLASRLGRGGAPMSPAGGADFIGAEGQPPSAASAGRTPYASDAELEASAAAGDDAAREAIRLRGLGKPVGSVSPGASENLPMSLAGEVSVPNGTPAAHGAPQAAATAQANLLQPARPADAATAMVVSQHQAPPPEIAEARDMAQRAQARGDAEGAAQWGQAADEIQRRWQEPHARALTVRQPNGDVIDTSATTIGEEPSIRVTPEGTALLPGQPGGSEPGTTAPVPSTAMRMPQGGFPRTPGGEPSAERIAGAERVRGATPGAALPAEPDARQSMAMVLGQGADALARNGLSAEEQGTLRANVAQSRASARLRARMQPELLQGPGESAQPPYQPPPEGQSLVPSQTMPVTPGAYPAGGAVLPPGSRINPSAPMQESTPEGIRMAMRLRRRLPPEEGALPPGPTEGPAGPEPAGPAPVATNASGESSASQEAINRVRSEQRAQETRHRIDARTGKATPLTGVDAVDAVPGPHDVIVKEGPKGREVIAQGDRVTKPGLARVKGAKTKAVTPTIPDEVEQVGRGEAPAWLRPPRTEGTTPTAGEQAMTGVDLRRYAKSRELGYYRGGDGTEVLYDPSQLHHADLDALDSRGRLADVVNGEGTSPKPAEPTTAVTHRDRAGNEIRTVLTAEPEATRSAVAAAPKESTVEVRPADEAVPHVLKERAQASEAIAASKAEAGTERPVSAARRGDTVRVVSPKFPNTRVRYEVVDLDELRSSHRGSDFTPREDYPHAFQPRDRGSLPNKLKISEDAQKLDPERMGANINASDGAPIIGPDNVVESGNGRTMMFERARDLHPEQWKAYQSWLRKNAEEFGLDPKGLDEVKNPVLVRRRVTEMDAPTRAAFAGDANVGSVAQMSAKEQAKADAQHLTPEMLAHLDVPESGDYAAPSNRKFAGAFAEAAVPHNERNTFLTTSGDLSQAGAMRVRAAVLARVFDRPEQADLVERMISSTDDAAKNISGAILKAAPALAKVKAVGAGLDRDITGALGTAAETAASLKARGMSIRDYLDQNEIFTQRDPLVDSMLDLFDRHGRSQKRMAEALTNFADLVETAGDTRQASFAGHEGPSLPPVRELWAEAKRMVDEEFAGQATLFGAGKAPRTVNVEKQAAGVAKTLRAQIAGAEAAGEHDVAANLKLKLKLVEEGYNPDLPGGPGAAGVEEFAARANEAIKAATGRNDPRVTEQQLEDKPSLLTYLAGPGFVFRHHPVMRRGVALLQRAIDATDRLRGILLERGPQAGVEGTGGWRAIQRLIPKGEEDTFKKLAWQSDAEERMLTPDELRGGGLSEKSILAYQRMHGLMDYALRHLVNPLRKDMGLAPLEGRIGYLPHRWFGSYDLYVDGVRAAGPDGTSSAPTLAEAYRWAAKLISEEKVGPEADVQIRPRYREMTRELPDVAESRALQALLSRLEDSGTVTKEQIVAAYKAGVRPSGFPRHFEYRRGVAGFEKERLLGEDGIVDRYLSEVARYVPMKRATENVKTLLADVDAAKSPNLFKAMNRLVSRVQGKPGVTEILLDDTLKKLPILGRFIDPNRPGMRYIRNTRMIVSHLKLGLGNVSAGLVNGLQFVTHASPVLGPKYALEGARAALMPTAEEAALIGRFEHLGLLEPMFMRGELANSSSVTHSVLEAGFLPMTIAEKFNRRATLLGAWKRLNDLGASAKGDRLVRMASDMSRERLDEINSKILTDMSRRVSDLVNFRYDIASRPEITTGALGELAGQFRTFTIGTMELQKRLFDLARKGEPAPFLVHAGAIAALSGALGFPFAYLIDDATRWISGKSPIDEMTKRLPSWATRGLPALAGVDLSRRVGMGDVTPQQLSDLAGPAISTLIQVGVQLKQHDLDMLARHTATGPGALYTLFRDMSDGVEREPSSRQRVRFQPDGNDLFWRFIGFQPEKASELTDTVRTTRRSIETYKDRRGSFIDEAVAARASGNHSRMFEILHESRTAGVPITFHDVLAEGKKKGQPTLQRLYESAPKPLRKELRQPFRDQAADERLKARFR